MGEFHPEAQVKGSLGCKITALICNNDFAICWAISAFKIMPQMYEVFINNRPLVIDKKAAYSAPNAMTYSLNFPWRKVVNKLVRGEVPSCHVQAADVEFAWQAFKQNFTVIEAAGGVVMKNQEILFIYRNGKWDLPKGKLEQNESIPVCALREVEEECGISKLTIVKELPITYHSYRQAGKNVLKVTYWFLMNCTDESSLVPQTEESIELAEWKNEKAVQIALENTYQNIKLLLGSIKL